jgi:hypothetical protein
MMSSATSQFAPDLWFPDHENHKHPVFLHSYPLATLPIISASQNASWQGNAGLGLREIRDGSYLVGGIGLEPTTFAMSTQRSNQLS